jgi:OmcA/MtrC family decaheme c-type cytochrome
MFRKHSKKGKCVLFCMAMLLGAFMLFGCNDGSDGSDGADGADGAAGPAGADGGTSTDLSTMTAEQQAEVTVSMPADSISVTIASPPVVTFALVDEFDRPILGLDSIIGTDRDSGRIIRWTMAKLVTGTNGYSDSWLSYVVNDEGSPTYDSPYGGGTLVANVDNTYTYTFATDVGIDPAYDPTVTHRVAGQLGGGGTGFEPINWFSDFVPDGSDVTQRKDIAMTASCNECHDPLNIHGRRREVGYCVTCHNPGLVDGDDSYNLAPLVHAIHVASPDFRPDEDTGIGEFAEVTYPQDLRNCLKCHNGSDEATPQGDNWKNTKPTRTNCFTQCHGIPDSLQDRAAFHDTVGIDDPDNPANCAACHDNANIVAPVDVAKIHTTPNATANNPGLLAGQRDIDYEMDAAAITAAGELVITFRILSDGTALDLTALPTDLAAGNRWPGFLIAYAQTQDGIAIPADFNNYGRTAGQPQSISLADLEDGSAGTLACAGGTCTATTLVDPFPVGAKMRTVGLQGYFRQDLDGDSAYDVSLHTQSAVVTVTTADEEDPPRRSIADSFSCSACHEIFEGHGGNRVFTADGGVDICTLCHNPNLSSSGRSIDPLDAVGSDAAIALGTTDTSTWPEATNTFKDMIHGIHASDFRTTDYEFVRGRNDGIYYNWSEVTFPGEPANCTKCHLGDSYLPEEVPESALVTTNRTLGEFDNDFNDVLDARDSMPNITDKVITPVAGACYACHDGLSPQNHMGQNGGSIDVNRDAAGATESCAVCHGTGNIADVEVAHGLLD